MPAALPVLIVGGGIGGLAAAIGLAQRGIASRVLERRPAPSESGAGIQIGPNGVRALRWLDLADLVAPYAAQPREIAVYAGRTGSVLARLPLGTWIEERHGDPYWTVRRGDLQAALLARAAREPLIEIVWDFDVARIHMEGAAVSVEDGRSRTVVGTTLIGADGQFSQVRQQLFASPPLRPSGKAAARSLIATDAVVGRLATDATGVWLAPGAHVVHYPVRQGAEIAVVVIMPDAWHDQDWSAPIDSGRLAAALTGFAPVLREALGAASQWRRWSLWQAEPITTWSRGRAALLGDAAHPILPFLAQGGVMALEDAVALAECLAAAGDPEVALLAYSRARMARAHRVAAASRRNGRIYHLSGVAALLRNAVLQTLSGPRLMTEYDWLYGWRADQPAGADVTAP